MSGTSGTTTDSRTTGAAGVALVTGASSGIGRETALELTRRGFTVYAGARRVERMADLREHGVRVLALDVTDDASTEAAMARIESELGRLDVLVNNAGYGSYGAVEDVPLEEGQQQFEVNVLGPMRLVRLAIPLMRRHRFGRIVNVTSIGGKIYTPFGTWYHGTKFALEGMSDVLRIELKQFGIDVVVVEPGAIRTEWGAVAAERLREASAGGRYEEQAENLIASMLSESAERRASEPSVIARAITTAATARRPRTRYAAGRTAHAVLLARRVLPDRVFDRLITAQLQGGGRRAATVDA